jgi:predicted ABC-type metal ion transport system, permease component
MKGVRMRDIPWSEIIGRIILPAIINTLQMMFFCFIFSAVLGFVIAVSLYITREDGLRPNKIIFNILNGSISILRSFPFMILMVIIIPLTRIITGSSIGWTAALVPLTFASMPFMARTIENSIKEVNPALIDAAKSVGASDMQIIFKVVIVEALPSLVTGFTLSAIHLLNLTTVAGAIGAGGLGASALQYGYQSNNDNVMYSIIVILVCMVILIQFIGDYIYKKIKN